MAKVFKIISNILLWIIMIVMVLLLCCVGYLAYCKFVKHIEQPDIFGISSAVVVSGSMSPSLNKGDYIIVVRQSEYAMGDIITFKKSSDNEIITHRVIYIDDSKYETAGDVTGTSDGFVNQDEIYGKVVITLRGVGYFFDYLKTPTGIIMLAVLVVILIVGGVIINAMRKSKKISDKNS